MGTKDRSTEALLNWLPAINDHPHRYDFHTILRCIECAYQHLPILSESLHLDKDPVRLSQPPFLQFSGHGIDTFKTGGGEKPHYLSSYLFGLFGPRGPLPIHITEYIDQCLRQDKDAAPAAFLNVFHHRLLSFYYRAWANTEPLTQIDHPGNTSIVNDIVGSLAGNAPLTNEALNPQTLNDLAQCYSVGQLGMRQMPVENLRALLSHSFDCVFDVERFVPQWVNVETAEQLQLAPLNRHSKPLGYSLCLGNRVRTAQQHIRLIVYPNTWQQLTHFLPNALLFQQLTHVVRRAIGHTLSWTLQLRIQRAYCPHWQLGQTAYLGWTLCLPPSIPISADNSMMSVELTPDLMPLTA